ncbi:MAG: polymerase [Firmicutes bacterium]|nr:polymerase [Bacillota bacterium]
MPGQKGKKRLAAGWPGTWSTVYAESLTAKTLSLFQTTLGHSYFLGWLSPAVALPANPRPSGNSYWERAGRRLGGLAKQTCSGWSKRFHQLAATSWFIQQSLRAGGVFLLGQPAWSLYLVVGYVLFDYFIRQFPGTSWLAGVWDELLFFSIIGLWAVGSLWDGNPHYRPSALGWPIMVFVSVSTFLLLVVSPQFNIAFEGWRVVVEYILWYFVGLNLLSSRGQAKGLMITFLILGTVLALHGIYQYAIGVEIPSSWIDSQHETAVRTRAFSILGSPNVLGSLFVLIIPMGLALFLSEKEKARQLLYLTSLGLLSVCLLFTFSRGAWLSLAGALVFFGLRQDRRVIVLLLLVIIATPAIFPSASERLAFLTTPEFRASSEAGGRLARWEISLDRWERHPYTGLGLGRFGGAVANRHEETRWFYTDNYYLKTATEMGLIGLTAFLWLLLNCLRAGSQAIARLRDPYWQLLGVGILAGLIGVLLHNTVENIFEVPALTTYFWFWLGILVGLGQLDHDRVGNVKA